MYCNIALYIYIYVLSYNYFSTFQKEHTHNNTIMEKDNNKKWLSSTMYKDESKYAQFANKINKHI